MTIWAAQWHSHSNLDGDSKHICNEDCLPVLFRTREAARGYIDHKYGYIRERPDLRAQPHGWRIPRAVKVIVTVIK
jgi:hypothetical protein